MLTNSESYAELFPSYYMTVTGAFNSLVLYNTTSTVLQVASTQPHFLHIAHPTPNPPSS